MMKKLLLFLTILLFTVLSACDLGATKYTYNDFTANEKKIYFENVGEIIPFIANNEYYVLGIKEEDDYSNGILFYTVGNKESDYDKYKTKLESLGFENTSWSNSTGYLYEKDNLEIVVFYYEKDGKTYIEVKTYLSGQNQTPNTPTPEEPNTPGDGTTPEEPSNPDSEKQENISYVITSSMPEGLTYITNSSDHPEASFSSTGGLKMRFENQGVETEKFNSVNKVNVVLKINALNENTKESAQSEDIFTIYGLNANGEVVVTSTLKSVVVGNNEVMLSGNGIVSVKAIMTGYPHNGNKYCNVVLGEVKLIFDGNSDSGDNPGSGTTPSEPSQPDNPSDGHLYNDFTSDEKELFNSYFGFVIPFVSNDDYYVDEYTYEDEVGLNFYTFDNTENEFNDYRNKILNAGFMFDESGEDESGDIWYLYSKGETYLDVCYYLSEDDAYVIDLYIYYLNENSGGDGGETPEPPIESESAIQDILNEAASLADQEALSGDRTVTGTIKKIDEPYTSKFDNISFILTDGIADILIHRGKGDGIADLVVGDTVTVTGQIIKYQGTIEFKFPTITVSASDNTGDSNVDVELITNNDKGLPDGTNGVYNVNFNNATYAKNVTEQGYYLDGCPTSGDVKVLVIPVEFSDKLADGLGYSVENIDKAFNGSGNDTDYYSVKEYYFTSSYEQLNLDFVVCDEWFKPDNTSSHYANQTDSDGNLIGDQIIMDEALAYLSTIMDLSQFDSDGNSIIDAVVLIPTVDIDSDSDFNWAYRYWNMYTDEDDYYYEYDNVSANDYLWAPYLFLHESYDEEGYAVYDDKTVMNTYTFIHEFGHVLGADDYYDYTQINSPLDGCDIMDYMNGDHNPYTKFNYGWLTTSRLVVAEESVTLTLEDFSKAGDTIIIANNWDPSLGAYQEYYVLMYYKGTGLNGGDYGYFANDGVVMYHVNASLYKEVYEGETRYNIYNNNTDISDEYGNGTEDNLIELVKSSSDTYVHIAGYSSDSNILDDSGNKIAYTFTVDSITDEAATITFVKNN